MTPNTRQCKSRLAGEHTDFVEALNIVNKDDVIDLVVLSLKNLGLYSKLQEVMGIDKATNNAGRKFTPFAIRKLIWDFYHEKATPSTNTTRPAMLKLTELPRIQVGLDFVGTTIITMRRNKQFYKNVWMMLHTTYHKLYVSFKESHPDISVSLSVPLIEAILCSHKLRRTLKCSVVSCTYMQNG